MLQKWSQKFWFIVLCIVIGIPAIVNAAAYEVREVVPASGFTESRAYGINNNGEVVGRFFNYNVSTLTDDNKTPFLWNSMTDDTQVLSTLGGQSSAWAISDTGYVVGYSYNADGYQRAVRWDTSGSILDMGTFANSYGVFGNGGFSYNVDDQGNVVGEADIPNDTNDFTVFHAFFYDDGTSEKTDLGTLNTFLSYYQYGYSVAYGMNNQQEAVGTAYNDNYGYDPFIYDATLGMRALPKDPAYSDGEWKALAINENGAIAGFVTDSVTSNEILYYWPDSMTDPVQLTLPAGFSSAEVYSININGQMVGVMWGSDGVDHAFVYDPENGIVELNQLIDPDSGWNLEAAVRINDAGQIVGYGTYNGAIRGFLLSPEVSCSLSAEPTSINQGQTSTLTWSSTNATSCTGTNFSTGGTISGSTIVTPGTTTTYSVTCTGAGDSADASATVTITEDYPDLIVSALTGPKAGGAGKSITVSDTTKNQGAGDAGPSTTKFYLSTNSTYDSGDVYLGQRSVPSLASGAADGPVSTSLTIPAGTTTGNYYIIAKADADGVITETIENNNAKNTSIKIGPDLIVSKIATSPSSPVIGQSVKVTVTAKNMGGSDASGFQVDIYKDRASAPPTGLAGDASCSIGSLAAGAVATCVQTISYAASGTYTIWAQVDTNQQVSETNETNNTNSRSITVNP
jgi:probable HAF family extracellular repeat protein